MLEIKTTLFGGCLCGNIRYEVKGKPGDTCICHCSRCQRWSGSAFVAGAGYRDDTIEWNKDPEFFSVSEKCRRSFCPKCGSSLAFHYSGGQVWITIGTLDDPEKIRPQFHQFTEDELSWAQVNDDLPRHEQSPTEWKNE
jgi:hypothetical protein